MKDLMMTAFKLSLSGSLFILVILLCKPLVRNKFSKGWQYYIWLVVIARLLLPFSLEINILVSTFEKVESTAVALIPQLEQTIQTQGDYDVLSEPYGVMNESDKLNNVSDVMPNSSANNRDQSYNVITNETKKTPIMQQFSEAFTVFLSNLWLIWLMVALILLIRRITIYQSFIRYIKAGRTEVSDIVYLEIFGKIVEQEKIKRTVGLYTNSLISSPLLIGFFRPCIILPTAELSDVDFRNTILHELTHYKQLDMFYKWLVQLAICLHWFNPLVYLMGREINRACELSCDEAVIVKLNIQEQKAYGNTLINALAMGNYNQSLASLSLNEGKEFIKERLDSIMNFKRKSVFVRCATLMLTLVFMCGFTVTGTYAASNGIKSSIAKQETVSKTNIKTVIIDNTDVEISNFQLDDKIEVKNFEEQAFSLIFSFISAQGFQNNKTFVLEDDRTIEISTKMWIEEGELNFTIQPIQDGYYISNGKVYDAKGKSGGIAYQVDCAKGKKVDETKSITLKAGKYLLSLKGTGKNAKWEIIGSTASKTSTVKANNSAEVIKPSDIDTFAMELIKTTNCWDTIENFLPYMTSTGVENVVATVRKNLNVSSYPGYEEALTKAARYFGKGTKTDSDLPLTRGDINEIAVYMIDRSANWSYVKPLFPYMTKSSMEQVVTIFLQKTGNYEIAKEAEVYMDKPISSIPGKRGGYTGKTGGIDFAKLPNMTTQEVDTLAINYINNTGEFGFVYNLRQYMSTKGIDEAVALYVSKTGDYGLVGAMLQFMSENARITLAEQYFKNSKTTDYDWIYKPYKKNMQTTQNKLTAWDFGEVPRCAIKNVISENIVVNIGGNSFKIEVDEASKDSYTFSDGIHTTSKKREIDFGRKSGLSANAVYSSLKLPMPKSLFKDFLW